MAKGDTVTVGSQYGREELVIEKAGRKFEMEWTKDQGLGWLLVHEKTWTNKIVKTTRFAASAVIMVATNFEVDE